MLAATTILYTIHSWRRIILLLITIIIYFLCKNSQFPERDTNTILRCSVYLPCFLFLYDYYGIPFRFPLSAFHVRTAGRERKKTFK